MTTSTALVTTGRPQQIEEDMFSDLEPISAVEVKKDYLAAQMAALMSYCEKNRSEMAHGLGWKKSRVTRVLSGKENLTVKSIWEFSSYLGYDFDVVFHGPNEQRPNQPWHVEQRGLLNVQTIGVQMHGIHDQHIPRLTIEIQRPREVAQDLITGNHKRFYFSFIEDNDAAGIAGTLVALNNQSEVNSGSLWPTAVQIPIA